MSENVTHISPTAATDDLNHPPTVFDKYAFVDVGCDKIKLIKVEPKKAQCYNTFSYSDLATAVTQRMYDYHYAYAAYIKTPVDSPKFQKAFDRLMNVFSKKLTFYRAQDAQGKNQIEADNWKGTRDAYRSYHDFINGFTSHSAINVRVRPICGSTKAQASLTCNLMELTNYGAWVAINGFYDITLAYEDGVWRFITWRTINNYTNLQPEPTTPEGAAPPYLPLYPVPRAHCDECKRPHNKD